MDSIRKNHKEFIKNKKLISKSQQRFKSEEHNIFTEKINKITLSANNDKRIQSTNPVETYAYKIIKDLVCKKEEIKWINIAKQYENY